ncbi:glycoside hydrolase [Pontibacter harenae]|uniref:glycoside hydrolase n=1 Tax=Pontibacter harenae TaxID=2894083 RepID=UPI001E3635AE|nr:glycoside hydrolase [Pontibacter harenae]MCC9169161.1 beta-glycosidase [Pontibacter harenae]
MYKFFQNLVIVVCLVSPCATLAQKQKQHKNPTVITVDALKKAQVMDNFGASGCWFSEGIGKYWPDEKKERIAELLFSKEVDAQGNPKGIGLSAWRFNIGGGTAEQGDSSGIRDVNRRVESFLSPDGTYDWSIQAGYRWFLRRAKDYGVERLIAFSNTPPVQFTQNGLGFKTIKDYRSNLRPDKYTAYTDFLAEVIKHFEQEGIRFDYISPVNEPQWDWSNKFGEAKQEGTPWTNEEISRVVKALDNSLTQKQLQTEILFPEAGMLTYLYGGSSTASKQVQQFFGKSSNLYLGDLKHVPRLVVGHSYFTDSGDSAIVAIRKHAADTVKQYGVDFWQSEYSMLGDGFREGIKGRRSAMDCALFLAKLIHQDLTVGNAAAWQFWNAYEPVNANVDTRYYLIALQPDKDFKNGNFSETKNLWALGHYSLFIRPGMHRVMTHRSDGLQAVEAAQKLMVSAFADGAGKKVVLVAVNYENEAQALKLDMKNFPKARTFKSYVTTASSDDNMKAMPAQKVKDGVTLPPRSITTIVIERQ